MVDASRHRGPDAEGIFHHINLNSQFYLGANRLMVIDNDDRSNQPFTDDSRSGCLIFNGQIYNFFDLKNKLLSYDIRFKTASDTEVLFHWLKIFGEAGIADLDGMFAFVFLDLESNNFFIARDRFGIKPIYYYHDDRYLIVSSEARGIIASGLVEKRLHEPAVHHYFCFRYSNKPATFFENIYEIAPGQCMIVSNERDCKFHPFLRGFQGHSHSQKIEVSTVHEMLKESLLKHLYAHNPAGIMLSGGIDSSLLLAMAAQEKINLPAFSITTDAKRDPDTQYARRITKQLGAKHWVIETSPSLFASFPEWVSTIDMPVADSAAWLTYLIAKKASAEQFKVLLSGAGADEQFAGYNRHIAFYYYLKYPSLFRFSSKSMNTLFGMIPEKLSSSRRLRLLALLSSSVTNSPGATFLNFLKAPFHAINQGSACPSELDLHDFHGCLEHDRNNYLVHDVLHISDQMSMRWGVELRMPYLQNDLMSYLRSCNSDILIEHGRKWILKNLLAEAGFKKIIKRRKQGFGIPLGVYFRHKADFEIWNLFQNKNSLIFKFVDYELFNRLLKLHKQNKADHSQALWSVLLLGHWLKQEFE